MRIFYVLVFLVCVGFAAEAAVPQLQDFDTNQFGTAGGIVRIKSGAHLTNPIVANGIAPTNANYLLFDFTNSLVPIAKVLVPGANVVFSPNATGIVLSVTAAGTNGFQDPGANGMVVRVATNTSVARQILGTADQIAVDNGTGVGGDPTIRLIGPWTNNAGVVQLTTQPSLSVLTNWSFAAWENQSIILTKQDSGGAFDFPIQMQLYYEIYDTNTVDIGNFPATSPFISGLDWTRAAGSVRNEAFGNAGQVFVRGAGNIATGAASGVNGEAFVMGPVNRAQGVRGFINIQTNVNSAFALLADFGLQGGTNRESGGLHILDGGVGGTVVTNFYGILIDSLTSGNTNWALRTGTGKVDLGDILTTRSGRIISRFATATNYTLTVANHYLVSTATQTNTLPAANAVAAGQIFIIKNKAGTTTVRPAGADTIDGVAADDVLAAKVSNTYISDGVSNWEKN